MYSAKVPRAMRGWSGLPEVELRTLTGPVARESAREKVWQPCPTNLKLKKNKEFQTSSHFIFIIETLLCKLKIVKNKRAERRYSAQQFFRTSTKYVCTTHAFDRNCSFNFLWDVKS